MRRGFGAWAALAIAAAWGCGGPPAPRDPEATKPPPEVVKPGVWEGFVVSRAGTVKIIGWIEPVVGEENVRIDYGYEFVSEPSVRQKRVHLYLDTRESGVQLGRWVGRKVAVVGRVQENQVVGHQLQPGWDTRRRIVAHVMSLVDVDVP
jgi:hypothetical protein